jgi:Thiol:disulfide interchange protein DsbD, N-terminal
LADPHSEVIRSFQVLNTETKGMTKGMAYPGYFLIDASGVIREKYFEAKYTNRFTPNSVIGKLFPELSEEVSQTVDAPHLHLTLSQSDRTVVPGSRVTLTAEIELPQSVHVYSPGVQGYKPIQLVLYTSPQFESETANYPPSETLYLEAINEKVPVFEGRFKITQDVVVSASKVGDGAQAGKTVLIAGELRYQACDKTVCYPPKSVPLKWELQVLPLDFKRSPSAIRHTTSGEAD